MKKELVQIPDTGDFTEIVGSHDMPGIIVLVLHTDHAEEDSAVGQLRSGHCLPL